MKRIFLFLNFVVFVLGLNAPVQATITYPEISNAVEPFSQATFFSSGYPVFTDVDGDGVTDFVMVWSSAYGSNSIRYYKLDANGNFLEATDDTGFSSVLCSGCKVAFDDFTGDGHKEIVTLNRTGKFQYYVNDGTENFTQKTGSDNPLDAFTLTDGKLPVFFDVNSDGQKDLVISGTSNVHYLLRTSTTTFEDKTGTTDDPFTAIDFTSYYLGFFDGNGDGVSDLLVYGGYAKFKYFEKVGSTFVDKTDSTDFFDAVTTIVDDADGFVYPAFYDFTGDGQPDLVTNATDAKGLDLYARTGDSFTWVEKGTDFIGTYGYAPFFYDLDGDGDHDLFFGGFTDTFTYYAKTDTGVYESAETSYSHALLNGTIVPAFSDIDEDGNRDLIIADQVRLHGYRNNADGTFSPIAVASDPFAGISVSYNDAVAFYDLSGDGRDDIILGKSNGIIEYYLKNADTSFTQQTGTSNPFSGVSVGYLAKPFMIDLDSDGDGDLVLSEGYYDKIRYYKNDGGVFTEQTGSANPFDSLVLEGDSPAPQFYDFTDDGLPDLTVSYSSGKFSLYINDGSGTFTKDTRSPGPFTDIDAGSYVTHAFFQVNDDGFIDLVAGTSNDGLVYFQGNSDALTAFTKVDIADGPFAFTDPIYYLTPVLEDIDDDGALDLVTGENSGRIHVYDGVSFDERTGSDNPFDAIEAGSASCPVFADFNGEGMRGLILGAGDGTLRYFAKDAVTHVFLEKTGSDNPFNAITADSDSAPTFFDVNGDGVLDLVLGQGNGKIAYYQNEGTSVFTQKSGAENPFAHVDIGRKSHPVFEDVNDDGLPDLVVSDGSGVSDVTFVYLAVDDTVSPGDDDDTPPATGDDDDTPPATGDDDDSGAAAGGTGGANPPAGSSGNTANGNAAAGDDDDVTAASGGGGGCSLQAQGGSKESFAILGVAGIGLGLIRIAKKRALRTGQSKIA